MRVIKFPFVAKYDSGTYLIDSDNKTDAELVISYGFLHGAYEIIKYSDEYSELYDAITTHRYDTLGYTTKEDLFNAHNEKFFESQAYSIDGVEGAVIGVTEDGTRFIYDYDLIIQLLQTNDNMSVEEALEWYSYNIERSFPYYQPSPIVIHFVDV